MKNSFRIAFSHFTSFYTCVTKQTSELRPPLVPYRYQTPKGIEIDLRLFNKGINVIVLFIYLFIYFREGDFFSHKYFMIITLSIHY